MNSMKIQYLERKSEEMHLSGQTAEHRCWHDTTRHRLSGLSIARGVWSEK